MSEFKHTPGPWVLRRNCVIVAGPFAEYTNGSAQSQIAMPVEAWFMADGEKDANAKLMAAAPELLEALQRIHIALEQINASGDVGRYVEDELEIARAAIQKATD